MKGYYEITDVYAREILDSRGNPTVEVEVILDDCILAVRLFPAAHLQVHLKQWSCVTAATDTTALACRML